MCNINKEDISDISKQNYPPQNDLIDISPSASHESMNQSYINKMNYFAKKRINLYKTEMCRSFEETGGCKYGDRCQFAHNEREIRRIDRHPRYKTETCRTFWEEGTCPYGKRCCFIHLERNSMINNLDDSISMNPIDSEPKEDGNQKIDSIEFVDDIKLPDTSIDHPLFNDLTVNKQYTNSDDTYCDDKLGIESPIWDLKPFWDGNEALNWCSLENTFCYIKYQRHRPRTHKSSSLAPGGPITYKSNINEYQCDLDKLGL